MVLCLSATGEQEKRWKTVAYLVSSGLIGLFARCQIQVAGVQVAGMSFHLHAHYRIRCPKHITLSYNLQQETELSNAQHAELSPNLGSQGLSAGMQPFYKHMRTHSYMHVASNTHMHT